MKFPKQLLRMAYVFERMVRCDLYLQADDGKWYRPINGWPIA